VTRIGLIADTHVPERCRSLPSSLTRIFAGVDLILHAGDVGRVEVLRTLEYIAPVLAVRGNDEPVETLQALPACRLLERDGRRILLIHGDNSDPAVESRLRREDRWAAKLEYWADRGRREHADLVVYGHTHVPTTILHRGVLLVNPGALGSGSFFHRQSLRTVAIMELLPDQPPSVRHVDVDNPERSPLPQTDEDRWFSDSVARFHQAMYDRAVIDNAAWIRDELYPAAPGQVLRWLHALAEQCWFEGREHVSTHEFVDCLLQDESSRDPLRALILRNEEIAAALDPRC